MGTILKMVTVCLFSVSCALVFSQKQQDDSRSITFTNGDSLVKTQACYTYPKKAQRQALYYWYQSGNIHCNYGSYSGKLLHGKYELFDGKNNLVKQGCFNYGLKEGAWVEWYPNGIKKEIFNYKKGIQVGENISFDEKGNPVYRRNFRNGFLNGKSVFYSQDTVIIKGYKKGKEVPAKKKKEKAINKSKEERKKLKAENKLIAPADTIRPERRERRPLFKSGTKSKNRQP